MTDKELHELYIAGDPRAPGLFLTKYNKLLHKMAWKYTSASELEHADLHSIACVESLKAFRRYDPAKNPGASQWVSYWLNSVLYAHVRKAKVRNRRVLSLGTPKDLEPFMHAVTSNTPRGPEEIVSTQQSIQKLYELLDMLPEEEHRLICARWLGKEKRTLRDIGKELGVSRTAISNREDRIFEKLRENYDG